MAIVIIDSLFSPTVDDHQATCKTWEDECRLPLLDAFTSLGGDHGPLDALFLSGYLVPFLGLDEVGLMDPYVAACQSQGSGGSGSGGATASGGSFELSTGGLTAADGAMGISSGGAPSVSRGGSSVLSLKSGGAPSTSTGGSSDPATESVGAGAVEGNGAYVTSDGPLPDSSASSAPLRESRIGIDTRLLERPTTRTRL